MDDAHIDRTEVENVLMEHKVYTAWQFVQYMYKNIQIVDYCYQTIGRILDEMSLETARWEQDLFADLSEETSEDGIKVKQGTVTVNNLPSYMLLVAGEKVDARFLFDKLLRDFFQYAMNAFDSIGQIANAGLLANKGMKVDSVDFQRMAACFAKLSYCTRFPKTSTWFERVYSSAEYRYIEAINNRTKHTADIANKLSMGILGSSNNTKIGPFFRKDVQHNKKELMEQLQTTLSFMNQSIAGFMSVFMDEVHLDAFTDNRRHEIGGVYQQKFMDDSTQNLSYAYIPVETDFKSMPDKIRILLVKGYDEIIAHDCPFDQILVCDGKPLNVVGRYIAKDPAVEDSLLHYRCYDKDSADVARIFYEMQGKTVFYHENPYFAVTTVSDDERFRKRTELPF